MRLLKADRLIFTLFLFSWLFINPSSVNASNQWQISNSIQVYYRLAPNEPCGLYSPISLGDFIKKTLPFEWVDGWANISNGDQALNAGAVAISSWSLSDSNSQVYSVNGQDFFCMIV